MQSEMESERKPLWGHAKKKKKEKPRFVNEESAEEPVAATGAATGAATATATATEAGSSAAAAPDVEFNRPAPSAPALEDSAAEEQRKLFRRLYFLLSAHVTLFAGLTVLFVYVPHLRSIMRRNVFDKLLLTSYIAMPLLLVILLYAIFPSLRRRFAVAGLTVLTLTIVWLLSYVISVQDAQAMLVSVGSCDVCCFSNFGASFVPRLNVASRKTLAFSPLFMLTSNAVLHGIFTRTPAAVLPAVATTALMTHFAFNARNLVTNHSLNPQTKEYSYSLVQMYLNSGMWQSLKSLFRRQSYQSI